MWKKLWQMSFHEAVHSKQFFPLVIVIFVYILIELLFLQETRMTKQIRKKFFWEMSPKFAFFLFQAERKQAGKEVRRQTQGWA